MEEMNFSSFSQDVFDPVEWLNSIFPADNDDGDGDDASQSNNNNKKTMANNLVFKLQLMVEETNNSLQELAQRLSLYIPKVIGEADVLNEETEELCDQIIDARTKLICSEQQHAEVIECLVQMDRAKKRLQDLYQALQEANNWSVLSMDVEEVLETGNVEQIVQKISSMQKSLDLLATNSSDGVRLMDKIQILENLKDRFEKLIEPILIDAFSKPATPSQSIEFYSNMFREFHRTERLIQYYQQCLREQILKEWTTQVKVVDTEGTVLDKLNFLYDRMSMLWKVQIDFCMKVIYPGDLAMSLQILSGVFTDILTSLDPTIESLIHRHLNRASGPNKPIIDKQKSLIELKQFTNSFVRNLEQNIVQTQGYEQIDEFVPKIKSLEMFIATIYQPLAEFNQTFLLLEKERLDDELADMQGKYEDMICNPCLLRLFSLIRESFKLYYQYVESYPLLVVEDVIEDLLLKYINCDSRPTFRSIGTNSSDPHKKSYSETLQLMPDWSIFQKILFKFQTLGDFIIQLQSFRQQVNQTLVDCKDRIEKSDDNWMKLFQRFDLFMLKLDKNPELEQRIQTLMQQPDSLMNHVLNECIESIKTNAQDICTAMFEYVRIHLNNLSASLEHELLQHHHQQQSEDEDDHSNDAQILTTYSPNEYITQIGQYLLMLPQHLEPFNLNENPSFRTAIQYSIDIFRNYSNLPSNETIPPSELLLECILMKTVQAFLDQILHLDSVMKSKNITTLTPSIRKKIGVDLSYLAAVCEDLGSSLTIQDRKFTIFLQIFHNNKCQDPEQIQDENPEHSQLIETLRRMVLAVT